MVKILRLQNKFISPFFKLNENRHEFNLLNEDFFNYYNRANFFSKYFLRRKVILLVVSNEIVGYMWYSKIGYKKNNYFINAFYIKEEYINIKGQAIFSVFNKGSNFYFDGKVNEDTANFLEELGFYKKNGTYEMSYILNNPIEEPFSDKVKFIPFQKGKYEKLRCKLQNEIFHQMDRRTLTVKDILIDEMQDYYVGGLVCFVKYENQFVGYG